MFDDGRLAYTIAGFTFAKTHYIRKPEPILTLILLIALLGLSDALYALATINLLLMVICLFSYGLLC